MERNPFSISFGKKPNQYIEREMIIDEITEEIESGENQCFTLTGVRGSGKTVTLTVIEQYFRKNKDVLVIDLNIERDMLTSLVAKLYDSGDVLKHFFDTGINLSAFGIGISVKNTKPVADIESALEMILRELKKRKKKLVVTIDEVYNNAGMKAFASTFQIMIRQELPFYLIMSGLYENIHALEDEKNLTFLYRAPKYMMDPLDSLDIKKSYMNVLSVSEQTADQMVKLTRGYPFAYQALGKYMWKSPKHEITEQVIEQYDKALAAYVYSKIWSELSEKDRWNMRFIAQKETMRTRDFLALSGQNKNEFSQYRIRLSEKGLIDISQRGFISVVLPRFSEFVKKQEM